MFYGYDIKVVENNICTFRDETAKLPRVPETLLKKRKKAQEVKEARSKASRAIKKVN